MLIQDAESDPSSPSTMKNPSSPTAPPVNRAGPSETRQAIPPSYYTPQQQYQSTQAPVLRPRWDAAYEHERGRSRARGRFCKALILGVMVWVLLGAVTKRIIEAASQTGRSQQPEVPQGPYPADGTSEHCAGSGNDWPSPPRRLLNGDKELSTKFVLPADADLLYLLSRGKYAAGSIQVEAEEGRKDVGVQVTATYNYEDLIKGSKVCSLERKDGHERGIGIFTPTNKWNNRWNNRLSWSISVAVPANHQIAAMDTNLPLFRHSLGDLRPLKATFGNLTLQSTNARMDLKDVQVATAALRSTNGGIKASHLACSGSCTANTSNGRIEGTYDVVGELTLQTRNGGISVDVKATNPSKDTNSSVVLQTENARIEAAVHFKAYSRSSSSDADGGHFALTTITTNGGLDVKLATLPADGVLTYTGRMGNGRAQLALPPTFEGAFRARTTNGHASVTTGDSRPADPKGKGRTRSVGVHQNRGREISGEVKWTPEGKRKTPMGSAHLMLENGSVNVAFP